MKLKKIVAIMMSMCMVSGLAACGSKADGETAAEGNSTDEVRDVTLTVWGPQED